MSRKTLMPCSQKVLCLIDDLGAGGAERQMVGLAIMLHQECQEVQVWYHEPLDFFSEELHNNGIETRFFDSKGVILSKILQIRKAVLEYKPDTVIAFLQSSSMIASIIRLSGISFKLIVSERNTNISDSFRDVIRFNLFRAADYVVPNSYSQKAFILKHYGFLASKIKPIVNYVDTELFHPVNRSHGNNILIVATLWPSKNALGLIEALRVLKDRGLVCHVKWFGKDSCLSDYQKRCENIIHEYNLDDFIELADKSKNIWNEYQKADLFCLPSFYEGTPNVVCEAMASGLPVICSDVCDNGIYVSEGENGFLFDPKDPDSIAEAMARAMAMDDETYNKMSEKNRLKAETLFSKSLFVRSYLELLNA